MLIRKTISVLLLVLIFGAILFAYVALPTFLATVLKNTFQKGTDCEVSLRHPTIDYLNVTASISDVSVICPNEKDGEGFFVSKIIAGIDLNALLNKKAVVTPLELYGANVKSLNWDSAFIKTIKFVLDKPERKNGGWSGWVPEIIIKSFKDQSESFIFGNENLFVTADDVIFTSIDPVDRPETAVILEARASGVKLNAKGYPPVNLGNLDLVAEAKQGKILFSDTKVSLGKEEASLNSRLSGFIKVKNKELFLDLDSEFESEYFRNFVKSEQISKELSKVTGNFKVKTNIRGDFNNPSFKFEILARELNVNQSQSDSPKCIPFNGISEIEFKDNVLSIPKFEIENLLKLDAIKLELEKSFSLTLDNIFSINLKSLAGFLCLPAASEKFSNQPKEKLSGHLNLTFANGELGGILDIDEILLNELPIVGSFLKNGLHYGKFNGKFKGNQSSPVLEGQLALTSNFEKKIESSNLNLRIDKETLTLNGNVFNPENKLELVSSSFSKLETKVKLDFKSFPLFYFFEGAKKSRFIVSANVDLKSPDSQIENLAGEIVVNSIDFRPQFKEFIPKIPIKLKLEDGNLVIKELKFDYEDLFFSAQGKIEKFKTLDIKTDVKGNIPEVAATLLSWESAAGAIDGSILIRGRVEDPQVDGKIILSDGVAVVKGGEGVIGIEDVNSTIIFDNSDLVISNFSSHVGDGELKITGRVNSYFDENARKGNILFSGQNLLFEPTAGLAVRLDTDLSLSIFPGSSPLLQGELVLTEAVYQKEITIQDIVSALSQFLVGEKSISRLSYEANEAQSEGLNLAIRARTSQGLVVDTTVFKAELDGDLRLSGKLTSPIVKGSVDIIDGSFVISQTKFDVLGGSMKFEGGHSLDPLISFSSEGDLKKRTRDIERIYLNISGHLSSTKVTFTSDGATPPKDILRQLGGSSGGSQLNLIQSDVKNIGFREVISPSSDLSLPERFAGLTGFDQVRIETAVSTRTGEFVPRILGSRPFPYDLRSTLWTDLSGDRASGARLEYRLRDNLSPFVGWRSQSVTRASSTNSSNFSIGIQFKETFKGISFIDSRVKESD